MPMLGVMSETLDEEEASMRGVEDFFSVARTMPFVAVVVDGLIDTGSRDASEGHDQPLIPNDVTPWFTALRAYSWDCQLLLAGLMVCVRLPICTSFPLLSVSSVRDK